MDRSNLNRVKWCKKIASQIAVQLPASQLCHLSTGAIKALRDAALMDVLMSQDAECRWDIVEVQRRIELVRLYLS